MAQEEEAFYGGAVGGGKTAALLMAALQYVDVPGYAALILRRTFPELEQPGNLIPLSRLWFASAPEALRPSYNQQDHEWTFPSGAIIKFGHLDNPNAMIRYQGGGYHMLGFDELTHFEEEPYQFISFSRTRKPESGPLAAVPIRVRATANPGGPGHGWVKRRFIDHRASDVLFVPAKVWDNPGIDAADYVKRLEKLPTVMRQQMLDGDWGVFEGAAFNVDAQTHFVPPLEIPDEWTRFESMDFGVTNPLCVLAFAADYDGNVVVFDSYYRPLAHVSEHASAILAKRATWWPEERPGFFSSPICYADPSMWAKTGLTKNGVPADLITEFLEYGVRGLLPANNDRRAGRVRISELLKPDAERMFPAWHARSGERGAPRLFIVQERCPQLAEQLTTAPLLSLDSAKTGAGEIVDPAWESQHGHAVATLRYGVMSRPSPAIEPKVIPDDPRAAAVQRVFEGPDESVPWYERENVYADV